MKISENPEVFQDFCYPKSSLPTPAMADVADTGDAAGAATPPTSAPSAAAAVEDDVVEAESPTNPQEKPTEAQNSSIFHTSISH